MSVSKEDCIEAAATFNQILKAMQLDIGYPIKYTRSQKLRALPHIAALEDAGYFQDDPDDLAGSFWMAGAGEETQSLEFFQRHPAYLLLSDILNEIFDQSGEL